MPDELLTDEEIQSQLDRCKESQALIVKGTEHPEERVPLYKRRPDRAELRDKIAFKLLELEGRHLPEYWEDMKFEYREHADRIIALFEEE